MKNILIVVVALILQGCLKTYSVVESDSTTKLVVNDIYLPQYQTVLLLNSMDTVVTLQAGEPSCPFDGGFYTNNHLGDIKLTKKASTKVININYSQPLYASYTITENLPGGSSVCKSSLRLDPQPEMKYKLSINGRECTAAVYESRLNSEDYIRSDHAQFGSYRDERLCLLEVK